MDPDSPDLSGSSAPERAPRSPQPRAGPMGSPPDEAFESRPPESGGARDHQGNEAPSGHLDDEEATPRRRLLGLGLGLLCAVGLVGAGVGWYFGADYREIPAGGVDGIVVLGGGLARANDHFLTGVQDQMHLFVLGAEHRPSVPVVGAALGETSGAVGAALAGVEVASISR